MTVQGDHRQDRQARRQQFQPSRFDTDPSDSQILLSGGTVACLFLAGLILLLWR